MNEEEILKRKIYTIRIKKKIVDDLRLKEKFFQ